VNGVGYLVYCSSRTLGRLIPGDAVSLHIETHVREDHIHLYGFQETAERDWYKLLTTVQGVGSRVGLAILSTLTSDQLVQAIASGDKAAISRAPGVGPKLAGRIASELKDKVAAIALGPVSAAQGTKADAPRPGQPVAVGGEGLTADATSALVNLGYGPSDALGAVSHAAAKLGEGADLQGLIRAALAELGPKEPRTEGAGG
jgi:Holliday junction DNA helicase RuvA